MEDQPVAEVGVQPAICIQDGDCVWIRIKSMNENSRNTTHIM